MDGSSAAARCNPLKDLIPRQLYKIAIQAVIGGRIMARERLECIGCLRDQRLEDLFLSLEADVETSL